MATQDSTPEVPKDRVPDAPATLEHLIEEERTRLLTAGTVLGCTSVAIENDRSADHHAFFYAHAIELARTMILQTTDRLDAVRLGTFYEQLQRARLDRSQIGGRRAAWNDDRDLGLSATFVDDRHGSPSVRGHC